MPEALEYMLNLLGVVSIALAILVLSSLVGYLMFTLFDGARREYRKQNLKDAADTRYRTLTDDIRAGSQTIAEQRSRTPIKRDAPRGPAGA